MSNAKWIWYMGDYELYHNIKLHERRVQYQYKYPAFWNFSTPYPNVVFSKTFNAEKSGYINIIANGIGYVNLDGVIHATGEDIAVSAGNHHVIVTVTNYGGLPAIYSNGELLSTDETWEVSVSTSSALKEKAGCVPAYTGADDDVELFPFKYKKISAVSEEKCNDGKLFDFGRESFGKIAISCLDASETYTVYCGESKEEALAPKTECVVWHDISGNPDYELPSSAFRYVRVSGKIPESMEIHAMFEYLDVEEKGSFECDRPLVKDIWQTCAHTFHLCSREFFLDAIKRDRWVWGGDARQSFMIANYIYADREICKRTILAMIPKEKPAMHVNNINDYSLYVLISLYEYYESFGDIEFVKFMWQRAKALYEFVDGRLDKQTGFMVARENDWIFIDWSDLDKDGPISSEQILLWHTEICMNKLCNILGLDGSEHLAKAEKLKKLILEKYWDNDRCGFIDSFTSGRNLITRHSNIFAILFDFVDKDTQQKIFENVLCNDGITQITTPYFKLYELMAICKVGRLDKAQELIDSYWGGMLKMGATSMWEQFDPNVPIPECYAMYGDKYQKSLCHAWSCGPIYFLGKYCLGVSATDTAYKSYKVEPNPGIYKSFKGDVPTEMGNIHVEYDGEKVTVLSELDGGTLIWNGKEYAIPKKQNLTVK